MNDDKRVSGFTYAFVVYMKLLKQLPSMILSPASYLWWAQLSGGRLQKV